MKMFEYSSYEAEKQITIPYPKVTTKIITTLTFTL